MVKAKVKKAPSQRKSPKKSSQSRSPIPMITVHIMSRAYSVPAEATIMGAIEHAGYQIIRGAGCREGFCGACATVYRLPGDYKLAMGLACTTLVQDGMSLAQIPSFPAEKAIYDIEELTPDAATMAKLYPVIFRCVECNTCTKACVQGLLVMDYIQAAKRGDIEMLMDLSFDCVSCGMCVLRCPAEITHYNVGVLGRRLFGRYLRKESPELVKRIGEISGGNYDVEYEVLLAMSHDELKKRYYDRDME